MAVLYWNTSTFVKSTWKSESKVQNTVHILGTFPTQIKGNWEHLETKGTAYWYQKGQQRRHDWCEIPHGTELRIIKHLFSGGSSKTARILFLIWILALTSFWTLNLFLHLAHSLSLVSVYILHFLEWKVVAAFIPRWEQGLQCLSAIMYTNRGLIQAKMTGWETKILVWVIRYYSTKAMNVLNKQRVDEKLLFKSYTRHLWSLLRQTLDWSWLIFLKN